MSEIANENCHFTEERKSHHSDIVKKIWLVV